MRQRDRLEAKGTHWQPWGWTHRVRLAGPELYDHCVSTLLVSFTNYIHAFDLKPPSVTVMTLEME